MRYETKYVVVFESIVNVTVIVDNIKISEPT